MCGFQEICVISKSIMRNRVVVVWLTFIVTQMVFWEIMFRSILSKVASPENTPCEDGSDHTTLLYGLSGHRGGPRRNRPQTPDVHGGFSNVTIGGQVLTFDADGFSLLDSDELDTYTIPNVVHYVLCGDSFQFEDYLGVLSAWKVLRPFHIVIHLLDVPKIDPAGYNDWFYTLIRDIPNLVVKRCVDYIYNRNQCFEKRIKVVSENGGINVKTNVLFHSQLLIQRKYKYFIGFQETPGYPTSVALIMGSKGKDLGQAITEALWSYENGNPPNHAFTCLAIERVDFDLSPADACYCSVLVFNIYPADIFTHKSGFAKFLKILFYGRHEGLEPKRVIGRNIPNIIHYIWLGGKAITFMMYLSFYSSLKIVNPDRIFIHGDILPSGYYWNQIESEKKVTWVEYGPTHFVYGHFLRYKEHASDVIRTDVLLRYGGIYSDWDVLWLKPVDSLTQSGYDVILAYDHADRSPFPDSINTGVMLAAKGAKFLKLWQDSFHSYTGEQMTYHAVEMPYKLYEKHPHLVHIERRLQVMCFRSKCHPLWLADYKNMSCHHEFDWTTDAYAIHFTSPDPKEYSNMSVLERSRGFFADIGRYILNYI